MGKLQELAQRQNEFPNDYAFMAEVYAAMALDHEELAADCRKREAEMRSKAN